MKPPSSDWIILPCTCFWNLTQKSAAPKHITIASNWNWRWNHQHQHQLWKTTRANGRGVKGEIPFRSLPSWNLTSAPHSFFWFSGGIVVRLSHRTVRKCPSNSCNNLYFLCIAKCNSSSSVSCQIVSLASSSIVRGQTQKYHTYKGSSLTSRYDFSPAFYCTQIVHNYNIPVYILTSFKVMSFNFDNCHLLRTESFKKNQLWHRCTLVEATCAEEVKKF